MSYPVQSALLKPGRFFHLRQRATKEAQQLFSQPGDEKLFLQKLHERSRDVFTVYGFALLPDHYHLLLKIYPVDLLFESWEDKGKPPGRNILRKLPIVPPSRDQVDFDFLRALPEYIQEMATAAWTSQQIGAMLSSYAHRITDREMMDGGIFERPFLRREIPEDQVEKVLIWLHRNARHHRVESDYTTYKWTSYQSYLSEKATVLPRMEILNRFGGREGFVRAHERLPEGKEAWRRYCLE